jgi:hypothetical protein
MRFPIRDHTDVGFILCEHLAGHLRLAKCLHTLSQLIFTKGNSRKIFGDFTGKNIEAISLAAATEFDRFHRQPYH